jgi:hypothetical protein
VGLHRRVVGGDGGAKVGEAVLERDLLRHHG